MPPATGVSDSLAEARAFAESVAGVLGRAETRETASRWVPGEAGQNSWPEIDALLDELGWDSLTQQAELVPYAGLAAVELGKQLAPVREDYKHKGRFESNSAFHFQSLLLNHQTVVAFTEARLDLGPWQAVLFVELDGLRPKRVLVKVMGE